MCSILRQGNLVILNFSAEILPAPIVAVVAGKKTSGLVPVCCLLGTGPRHRKSATGSGSISQVTVLFHGKVRVSVIRSNDRPGLEHAGEVAHDLTRGSPLGCNSCFLPTKSTPLKKRTGYKDADKAGGGYGRRT
jgi:hypothetical protein